MKRYLILLPLLGLCAGCMENSVRGTGVNSSGAYASGTISKRSDGSYALMQPVKGGYCTAVFHNAKPYGRELRPLTCSGGKRGNATIVYTADGTPDRATYGGV
ncbi:hypothetical protein FGG78_41180, partial [Thioclava sp. BHET1]